MNPIGDEDLKPTHAYDDVAKEEVSETESKTMENETEIKENTDESNPESESSGNNSQQKSQVPVRKAPPVPPQKHPSDQQSNHSYEEIAASEVASEVNFLYTHLIFVLKKIANNLVCRCMHTNGLTWMKLIFLKIFIFRFLKI